MLAEQENIFNVPYSLPNSAHPIALATRTPSNLVKVDSTKFIPDYGGSLEVPGTESKQYCLRRGVPFKFNPATAILVNRYFRPKPAKDDAPSVVVASYLNPSANSRLPILSAFKALGSTLYCDAFHPFLDENKLEIESTTYTHVPYPFSITGLKYHDTKDKFLIVKSRMGCKLMRLNAHYDIPDVYRTPTSSDTEDDEPRPRRYISERPVFEFEAGFPERRGLTSVDACLPTNQRIFAMLGNDAHRMYIKLYDLEHSKKLYKNLIIDLVGTNHVPETAAQENAINRKKSLRSFVPVDQPLESISSLEFDPSHLLQMVVTTSERVLLMDIRKDAMQHSYVDRRKLLSVLPTEKFNQVVFSKRCDKKFYMLSSEKVRAFDKRYLSQPMCSIDHMLGPHSHESMKIKLVKYDQDDIETLCISSCGRLCFMSFDGGCGSPSFIENAGELINPRSIHAPVHKARNFSGQLLYGLDVANFEFFPSKFNIAFSVFNITRNGDICVKGFHRAADDLQDVRTNTQAQLLLPQHKAEQVQLEEDFSFYENEYKPDFNHELPRGDCLDILDTTAIAESEQKLNSKRALDKYNSMKRKLYLTK